MLGYFAQLAFFTGKDPEPTGSQHQYLVPYGTFAATDGAIVIACLTPSFWGRICEAIERPELADDPRYDSLEKRRDAREQVNALVTDFTSRHTVAQLVAIFTAHEVPHAPILKLLEALDTPQARHREMVVEVAHAALGKIPIVNRPFKFDEAMPPPAAPPILGQHTDEILRDVLDWDAERISALRSAGVIG